MTRWDASRRPLHLRGAHAHCQCVGRQRGDEITEPFKSNFQTEVGKVRRVTESTPIQYDRSNSLPESACLLHATSGPKRAFIHSMPTFGITRETSIQEQRKSNIHLKCSDPQLRVYAIINRQTACLGFNRLHI